MRFGRGTNLLHRARTAFLALGVPLGAMLGGCADPTYDTSTPEALLDSMQQAVKDSRYEDLPRFIEIAARDIQFEDGVTEESAIGDVKGKLSDMLGQMKPLVEKDSKKAKTQLDRLSDRFGFGPIVENIITDPFKVLDESRDKLSAEDLGDGTAALSYDGDPIAGGFVALVETGDGWRVTVPIELVQSNEYWPQTRHEWAVIASLMLSLENSLNMFEEELDAGKFKTMDQASERVGRLLGESVIVQSVIYAMMKREDQGDATKSRDTR